VGLHAEVFCNEGCALMACLTALREVTLSMTRKSRTESDISHTHAFHALQTWTNLEVADILDWPYRNKQSLHFLHHSSKLRALTLGGCQRLQTQDLFLVLQHHQHTLEKLEISDCEVLEAWAFSEWYPTRLREFELWLGPHALHTSDLPDVLRLTQHWPALQKLGMEMSILTPFTNLTELNPGLYSLKLRSIALGRQGLSGSNLRELTHLRQLHLGNHMRGGHMDEEYALASYRREPSLVSSAQVQQQLAPLVHLEDLRLTFASLDVYVLNALTHLPHLRVVCLDKSPAINAKTVKAVPAFWDTLRARDQRVVVVVSNNVVCCSQEDSSPPPLPAALLPR
jgi:hypothetical protein